MSKNINVNPGNYKVGGRERQGEDVVQDVQKRRYGQQHAEVERWQSKPRTAAKPPSAAKPRTAPTTTGARSRRGKKTMKRT